MYYGVGATGLDRLDGVTGLSQPMDFDYNEIGNMTKKIETDQPAKNYDIMCYGEGAPGPHAITTADPASGANHVFTYDANGSMLSETNGSTVHSFQYDADGMVSYRNTPAEDQAYYYYDPDGVLVRKAPNAIAFGTAYVGEVYENNMSGAEVTKYYFVAGARVAIRKGASLYYLAQDHLSGTAVITDPAKQMTGRIRYYPYGGSRTVEGTIPRDKLFTGQQRETTNGIYHYNARLYNADIGRMPQADRYVPDAFDSEAYNRYSYGRNNPAKFIDPTGNIWGIAAGWGKADIVGVAGEALAELDVSWSVNYRGSIFWNPDIGVRTGVTDLGYDLGWRFKGYQRHYLEYNTLITATAFFHECKIQKIDYCLAGDTYLGWKFKVGQFSVSVTVNLATQYRTGSALRVRWEGQWWTAVCEQICFLVGPRSFRGEKWAN